MVRQQRKRMLIILDLEREITEDDKMVAASGERLRKCARAMAAVAMSEEKNDAMSMIMPMLLLVMVILQPLAAKQGKDRHRKKIYFQMNYHNKKKLL